jgi:hypothetical protein
VPNEFLARRAQNRPAAHPVEQVNTELAFEARDRLRQRRLCDQQ